MLSYAVVSVLLVSSVFAWPQQGVNSQQQQSNGAGLQDGPSILSQMPQEWQDKLHPHIKDNLKSLNDKDMLVLKNVIQQLPKFNSLKEVRQTIKQYSPRAESLLEKHALMGMTIVAQKHAQLSPESRSAFHQVIMLGMLLGSYKKSMLYFLTSYKWTKNEVKKIMKKSMFELHKYLLKFKISKDQKNNSLISSNLINFAKIL